MKHYRDLVSDQLDAIDFIITGEDSLIAADVGTGKTVISLTAASIMAMDGEPVRWLVLAPLLVATDTWPKEVKEWSHLKNIKLAVACGTEEQRIAAIESDAQFVTMNYENLPWLMDYYKKKPKQPDPLPFNGLICDEIDKLKSVSSDRFKKFRNRINVFDYRIGLTGTLIPNDLTELWGQVYMVDGGQTFGRSFYEWRREFFYPIDFNQYNWRPFESTFDVLVEDISDLAYRLKAKGLPTVTLCEPEKFKLPDSIRAKYDKLEKDFFLVMEDKETGKKHEIDVDSAGVLSGKLQQICAGFSYVDKDKNALWHSKIKVQWLLEKLYEIDTEQALIFYHFNEELDEMKRTIPDLKHIGKGTSNKQALKYIDDFNSGKLRELALHPASAGHGLNLQKGGAHHIIFLTMPWSGGLFHQSVGRLARRGNPAKEIFVHTALFDGTVDLDVYGGVTDKLEGMRQFLDQLEAIRTKH